MNIKCIGVVFFLVVGLCVLGQNNSFPNAKKNAGSADSLWAELIIEPTLNFETSSDSGVTEMRETEQFRLTYRANGLKFWFDFPDDPRRYAWLLTTVLRAPRYWVNENEGARMWAHGIYSPIKLDTGSLYDWERIFPILELSFMNSATVSELEKIKLQEAEFYTYMEANLNAEYRHYKKPDLQFIKKMFSSCAGKIYDSGNSKNQNTFNSYPPLKSIEMLYLYRNYYGLSLDDLSGFSKMFLNDPTEEIRVWASRKRSVLKLQETPMEFIFIAEDGRKIDLKQMRGKVVLIDFWATWCGACIEGMPAIKRVYDKYREKGFEVISVCVDPKENKNKIQRVENKIGAGWPLLVIGGNTFKDSNHSLFSQLWDEYGFQGVPQLLLLDKNGLMIEYNGILHSDDIEPIVVEQIKKVD